MDNDKLIESLRAQLSDRKVDRSENGVALIGHLPDVGPQAYLHEVFPGLEGPGFIKLERELDRPIPDQVRSMLRMVNGVMLYRTALSLDGYRDGLVSRDGRLRQPFSILDSNKYRRPVDTAPDDFFIGGYNWGGSLLFVAGELPVVFRRPANRRVVLNQWSDIWTMLAEEIARIGQHFDCEGQQLDPGRPTTP